MGQNVSRAKFFSLFILKFKKLGFSAPLKKTSSKVLEKTNRECRTYCDFGGRSISRMHFVESKKTTSIHKLSFITKLLQMLKHLF